MAWGDSGNISTTNLESSTDDPNLARADLKDALDELIEIIDGRGTANGVASLDVNTKIPANQLPNQIESSISQNLILAPDTGRVAIQDILYLTPKTTTELQATTPIEGDVAYCSDGDAGAKCIAVYNGADWVVLSLGAAISTT